MENIKCGEISKLKNEMYKNKPYATLEKRNLSHSTNETKFSSLLNDSIDRLVEERNNT